MAFIILVYMCIAIINITIQSCACKYWLITNSKRLKADMIFFLQLCMNKRAICNQEHICVSVPVCACMHIHTCIHSRAQTHVLYIEVNSNN